jgi:predicted secreted protein
MTWDGEAVAGVQEKSVAINGEPIDVSSDENNGWRKLLEVAGQNQVDISVSGVLKSTKLKADWFAGARTKPLVLTYPDGGVLSGVFFLATYNEAHPYSGASTFDGSLQSSGAVTYTPGASG